MGPPGATRQAVELSHYSAHAACGGQCMESKVSVSLQMICSNRTATDIQWIRCLDPSAPRMFQRSAVLAFYCAGNLLAKRPATPELRCSGALLPKRTAAPACQRSKCSGAPLLRCSGGAPLHRHPTIPAPRCSGIVSLVRSAARALSSSNEVFYCPGNSLLRHLDIRNCFGTLALDSSGTSLP